MQRADQAALVQPWYQEQPIVSEQQPNALEVALDQARTRGYEEGLARGLAEARAKAADELARAKSGIESQASAANRQHQELMLQLQALTDGLEAALNEQASRAEQVAVEVAYAALLRVVDEAYLDQSLLKSYCQEALRQAGHKAKALRISPEDAALGINAGAIPVIEDLSLSAGQCVLETLSGTWELGLDVRLEHLRRAMIDGLTRHRRESSR